MSTHCLIESKILQSITKRNIKSYKRLELNNIKSLKFIPLRSQLKKTKYLFSIIYLKIWNFSVKCKIYCYIISNFLHNSNLIVTVIFFGQNRFLPLKSDIKFQILNFSSQK
ncbi:hypothetical protein BpHYR1_026755 [Brachionus plicatilis]|uniref:Uncharacterized protein n=1 Tax=Brachionus plicatilis TaxID=10195 RepID=A0A3M7R2E9_BRAPC|nr:hypothetical protein BpHYR1_026755 [Brachionus plicatilis]